MMHTHIRKWYQWGIVAGLYGALILVLLVTNPAEVPILVLILPFVLLFAALLMTVAMVIKQLAPQMPRAKRLSIAGCTAGLPTFLLVLSSINQLTWRDILLTLALLIAFLLYTSRANFS